MTLDVAHETFTIERVIARERTQVFSAWSDPEKKRKWYAAGPEGKSHIAEFRVGGREYGAFDNEMGHHENETRYFEIVENELIVFAYSMAMNGRVHTISLVTVRFEDESGGTRLIYNEQMTILPPSDGVAGREHGWSVLLDRMEAALADEPA